MAQNDYQKMASAFIDMWQQQLTRSMNDRDMVKNMMHAVQQMQQTGANQFKEQYEPQHRNTPPSSGAYDDELAELAERMADCEQRLAAIEAALRAANPAPLPRSRTTPAGQTRVKNTSGKTTQSRKAKPEPAKPKTKSKPKPKPKRSQNSNAGRKPSPKQPAETRSAVRAKARINDSSVASKATDEALSSLKKAVLGTTNRGKAGTKRPR